MSMREQAAGRLRRITAYHWTMFIISIIAVVLAVTAHVYFLFLLALPLFLTPVARETGLVEGGDKVIDYVAYQGSYVAFYLTLLILASLFVGRIIRSGPNIIEVDIYLALFLIPILYKFFASLSLAYGAKAVGEILGFVVGIILFIASFVGGFKLALFIIALLVIIAVVSALWYTKVGGGLIALVGMAYFVNLFNAWEETPAALTLSVLIGAPMILSGLLLFFHRRIVAE